MSPEKDPSSGTRRPVPAYIEATAETQAIPVVAHKMELAAARDALLQEKMSPVEAAQLPTSSRLDDLEAARERRKENRYKRLQRLSSLEPKRGPVVGGLGPWSFILPFGGYIAWWALGPGDLAWPIGAIIMVIAWQGVRGLRIPAPWVLWIAFLAWVPLTFMMIDTSGRVVGAVYRYILLIAPFIFAIHVYNARRRLPLRAILATMTIFLLSITVGGYIAMAFPELVIRTPMAYVLPDGLLSNELVREMAIRRTTQWEATNIIATEPRPSAPFLYANTWGNVYSLVLPLALVHCLFEFRLKSRWRWPAIAISVASVVPAVNTLNRGMFIGLGVVAVWVAIQFLLAGRWRGVSVGAALLAIVGFIWALSPSGAEFFHRAGFGYCFLLWPADQGWPPEIDFAEGSATNPEIAGTYHWDPDNKQEQRKFHNPDMTGWHTYGVIVEDNVIIFTLDGKETGRIEKEEGITDTQMFLGVQAAPLDPNGTASAYEMTVEGGIPNPKTPAISEIEIDWVAHYTRS